MQLSTVPSKLVEFSAFPVKDGKTRRLFILANGNRSLGQIFDVTKIEAHQGFELIQSMVTGGYLSLEERATPPLTIPTEGGQQPLPVARFIAGLTAELTKYIGPVASVIIQDFKLPEKEIDINQRRHIIKVVTEELDEAGEKARFLEAVKAAGWS